MGFFKNIESAKVGLGGIYFLANKGEGHTEKEPKWIPASYDLEILKITTMTSRKKDDLFIVECKIIKSDCPERKAGISASWVVNLKQDAAMGNIKGFIAAANGIDPSDEEAVNEAVTEEVCELAVSNDQPLAGNKIHLECIMIKTRENKDFTLHRWSPAAEAA
jgi:hypothetical protein